MKKLFIAVSSAFALTASAAQIDDSLIDKLLTFSVKDFITESVFDEVWKTAKFYSMELRGYQAYHSARSITYEKLGVTYEDWESYIQGRTIIVARVKAYFFSGENLKDTYLEIQPRLKEEFFKLTQEEKDGLRKTLSNTKMCFETLLKPEQQKVYNVWFESDLLGDDSNNRKLAENWLVNNLSTEDIAKRIRAGELAEPAQKLDSEDEAFKVYPDRDIAKFAGRRFKEGGEDLLRKYIEVIDLVIADTK